MAATRGASDDVGPGTYWNSCQVDLAKATQAAEFGVWRGNRNGLGDKHRLQYPSRDERTGQREQWLSTLGKRRPMADENAKGPIHVAMHRPI